MDLKQLEYFVRVAELGSFTRASIALDIAQPALSRQVRLLEVELRQSLLVRNGRGATPTEAGKLLLEHARGILHQVERARSWAACAARWPGACHRPAAQPGAGADGAADARLPPADARRAAVDQRRPLGDHAGMAGQRAARHCRALQRPARHRHRGHARWSTRTCCWCNPAHPACPKTRRRRPSRCREVARLPLVIPSRPNAIRMHVEAEMAAIGCRPAIALEIDGVSAILDLVADGAGSAILSRNAVASSDQAFGLHRARHRRAATAHRLSLATAPCAAGHADPAGHDGAGASHRTGSAVGNLNATFSIAGCDHPALEKGPFDHFSPGNEVLGEPAFGTLTNP
jgi:LysR family nitrogen assimilation transcriptional regulator